MYKIQVKSKDNDWSDLVNMPNFATEDEANTWLINTKVHLVSDIFEFRVVQK